MGSPPGDDDDAPAPPAAPPDLALPERYRAISVVGRGGMGIVVLAADEHLGRNVALKASRSGTRGDDRRRRRFVAEARATAQLEHPSIVPVYDLTDTADGELAFTMRYVEGRSLAQVLASLAAGDPETALAHSLTELLLCFLKICDGVAYAHDRGVLHRDLKPGNVMIGRFGEVFVMDWGLAGARADESAQNRVRLASVDRETAITRPGTIVGTPGYVAPEQVRGELASIASEIFALGAILYELLTLQRAVPGELPAAILANTVVQAIIPPRERAPLRVISEPLQAIVLRALDPDPAARFENVTALRNAVADQLEGAHEAIRRRARAEASVALARQHAATVRALGRQLLTLRRATTIAKHETAPEGSEALLESWDRATELDALTASLDRSLADAYTALTGARALDPDWDVPPRELVALLLEHAAVLSSSGERVRASDIVALARHVAPALVASQLDASARLEIVLEPALARLEVSRFRSRGPIEIEEIVEREQLDRSPAARAPGEHGLRALTLAPGEIVLTARADGHAELRLPLRLEPGERRRVTIELAPVAAIEPGFVVVPGGSWRVGGDLHAEGSSIELRTVALPAFAISIAPVSVGEWRAFLEDIGDGRAPGADVDLGDLDASAPAAGIDVDDAERYARWRSDATGRALRLPTSDEWEVAAAGGLDRPFVWGHGFDARIIGADASHVMRDWPDGVRTFDRSIFGARGMIASAREITATPHPGDPSARVTRGGAPAPPSADECRLRRISLVRRGRVDPRAGLRLVHPVRG